MKKKIRFAYVYPFEFQALENFLNEMAQEGWYLQKMREYYLIFEQDENREQLPHYSVGLIKHYHTGNPARESEETQKCKEFMEDFEYHYICGYGPFLIFEGTGSTPFHNDDLVTIDEVTEITKRYPKPLSDLPVVIACIYAVIIIALFISLDFQILLLADWLLWVGIMLLLVITVCLVIVRAPYRTFKKVHSLPKEGITSSLRLLSSILPLACIFIFSILANSYFLFILCALFPLCTMLQHMFYKYEKLIMIIQVIAIVILVNCDLSLPYAQTMPKEDIAAKLEVPYTSYETRSSPLLELEIYRLGDWNIITHYVIKDSIMADQIKGIIEGKLKLTSSDVKVVRISYSELWVFDTLEDIDITKDIEKVFPGE